MERAPLPPADGNGGLVRLADQPQKQEEAAQWFHEKWGIPKEAYQESMADCLRGAGAVPQWYLALEGDRIVGGLGVIENDFHPRTDLAPNVCAVYTEEDRRGKGVAGALLRYACRDMQNRGIDTLYLLTDHTSFYERYGWEFFCLIQEEGQDKPTRVYRPGCEIVITSLTERALAPLLPGAAGVRSALFAAGRPLFRRTDRRDSLPLSPFLSK